jgi:ABC-type Na+ efflux pump permease subunit
MGKIWTIAAREYNAAVRTKAFMVSIVLMPILMGGGIIAQKVLKNQIDVTDKIVAVVDHTGVLAQALINTAKLRNEASVWNQDKTRKLLPAYNIEVVEPRKDDPQGQQLELSDQVRRKNIYAYLVIGPDVIHPQESQADAAQVEYHGENSAIDDLRKWLGEQLNQQIFSERLTAAKMDAATVNRLTAYVPLAPLGLVSKDSSGQIKPAERNTEAAALLLPIIVLMLMFMMVMMGATPLINSVLEEKMQRIAEVLLGSASPFQIMMGKLLGMVGVSLTVVAVYAIGASVAARQTGNADRIPIDLMPWFFAYQVLAIFMFGAMFVAIGAACNDLKEAQSLMMPVWLVVVFPMFVWVNVIKEPLSKFATVMSLVPTCTPMLMILRQTVSKSVPAWQPWAGLAGTVLFSILCVWAAGRIFRVGILLQGKPPKIREIFRWALRG